MNYKNRDITTLRFNLNHAVLSEEGVTEDIVLAPVREHARKVGIEEPETGLFVLQTDENSFCRLAGWSIMYFLNNPDFTKYFTSVISTFDGEVEDCLSAVRR